MNGWFCEVCFQMQSLQGGRGYETFVCGRDSACCCTCAYGSFPNCPLKVYSVAVHIVAFSQFPRIFSFIRVVICAFWSAPIFRVFNIFFCMEQGVDNCSCYRLIHVCNSF